MIEFWAVVGLACLDHVFLRELTEHAPDIEGTVRAYGFRLSRFEMGELKRILRIPGAVHSMHNICTLTWETALRDASPCWWSGERSADYDRPGEPPYRHPNVNDPAVEQEDGNQRPGTH
jgi:hypothetical protein